MKKIAFFPFKYVFVSVMALISMVRITSTPISIALVTYMILLFQPLVMVVILIIMGGHSEFLASNNGTLVENLRSLIQLMMTSVLLLFSPAFTMAIVHFGGIHTVSNKIAKVGASAIMVSGLNGIVSTVKDTAKAKLKTGKKLLFSSGKMLVGTPLQGLGMMALNKLHDKSNKIKERAGFEPTYRDLQDELNISSSGEGKGSKSPGSPTANGNNKKKRFKNGMNNSTLGEKAVILGDFVVNRKRIKVAEGKRQEFVRSRHQSEIPQYETLPLKDFSQKTPAKHKSKNNQPQQVISNLNSGDGRLMDYSHEDKKDAVRLAKRSKSKRSRTWIKDKQLYWMLQNEVLKEEQALKNIQRKTKKNSRIKK